MQNESTKVDYSKLTIVIPTLNSAMYLQQCLNSIEAFTTPATTPVTKPAKYTEKSTGVEIILCDGGSSDNTIDIAKKHNCRNSICVLKAIGGRGGQIAHALPFCTREYVLILHSDCIVEENSLAKIIRHLDSHPQVIGGALGIRFSNSSPMIYFVSTINHLRSFFLKIFFGDQGQFFRRKPIIEAQAFPSLPLMEDVEFSLVLKKMGQIKYFRTGLSTPNYNHQGRYFKRFHLVMSLLSSFFYRRVLARLSARITSRFFKNKSSANNTLDLNTEDFYDKYYPNQ